MPRSRRRTRKTNFAATRLSREPLLPGLAVSRPFRLTPPGPRSRPCRRSSSASGSWVWLRLKAGGYVSSIAVVQYRRPRCAGPVRWEAARGKVKIMPQLAEVTIGVMGSGKDEHCDLAEPLGSLLAELGVNLLTGAGGGVMTSVSRAFVQSPQRRVGICIGIVPCRSEGDRASPRDGYPNEFVELPIMTHLPLSGPHGCEDLSRNHINILSSAGIIALPGAREPEPKLSWLSDTASRSWPLHQTWPW